MISFKRFLIQKLPSILRNGWLQHLCFWGCSYVILLRHFSISSEIGTIDHLYTILFHLSLVSGVYLHLRIWVRLFLAARRYFPYLLLLLATLFLMVGIHKLTFEFLTSIIFPDFYLVSYLNFYQLGQYYLVYIGVSTLLHQSKSWFRERESERKLIESERLRFEAELQNLKNQIHPHFLFNSLNSIYGLSLKKADELPDYILRLSDVLRYMLYEGTKDWIPLSKEIEHMNSYLSLQHLRLGDSKEISFHQNGETKEIEVPPFLFINLIENAFVHGGKNQKDENYVNIQLNIQDEFLELTVKNSQHTAENLQKKEGGVGLTNLLRRLELLYPEKHTFKTNKDEDQFWVDLRLAL